MAASMGAPFWRSTPVVSNGEADLEEGTIAGHGRSGAMPPCSECHRGLEFVRPKRIEGGDEQWRQILWEGKQKSRFREFGGKEDLFLISVMNE